MALSLAASRSFGNQTSGSFNGSQLRPNPAAVKSAPVVDLPALQSASHVLQEQFVKDAQAIPDIGEMFTAPGGPSSASYSVFLDDSRVPFQKRKLVGIPEALFQYYNTTSVSSHMGIMPEIDRVWITIDHKLFLWDYIDGEEISSFVDQPDVITHVALVRPKANVFVDEISYIMVICTPVSVLLIGVSSLPATGPNNRKHKLIKLYATDMSIQTDVEMISVTGAQDGRIFMCGSQDGNLYELFYQASESWFGKRVQLINHSVGGVQSLFPRFTSPRSEDRITLVVTDVPRNYIYTLTQKNSISVYRPNGEKTIQNVQTISNIYKSAQEKAPGSPALTPQNFEIFALHVVEQGESRSGVQLIAMTRNGVRLYFAPSALGYSYSYPSSISGASGSSRPLQLIHVRLPPSNLVHPDEQAIQQRMASHSYGSVHVPSQPTSRPYIVSKLDASCYAEGLTVASQAGDNDGADFILSMSPDLTRIGSLGQMNIPQLQQVAYPTAGGQRPPLTEQATLLTIPGRSWAMAPVSRASPPITSAAPSPALMNELATQFSEASRQFMILTNVGLTFLAKRRALDYLRAIIEEVQADKNVQPIIEFRDSFGRDQTCAMLLGLASGNTFLESNSEPGPGTISTLSPDVATVAKQAFYDFGERPIWTERVTYGTSDTSGTAIFSGRREGFALYYARLVRPFWKNKLTIAGSLGLSQLNIAEEILVTAQKNLYALKQFLDKNPHLFHSSPGESAGARTIGGSEQEAWKAEQVSVAQLQALLSRTIEAISFVLLLNDYRLGELVAQCDVEVQKLTAAITFEDLITAQDGITVSRALVNVVINQQIGQQISVDTISEVLQDRCGSFCSTDDVMLYKARENIRKAVETRNPAERQNWLSESLRLFTRGARTLEFDKIREICGDYQQLSYARGAVDLPLSCAHIFDPDNVGLQYWYAGSPANDPRAEKARRRLQCYDLVLDSLAVFEDNATKQSTGDRVAAGDADTVRGHAYDLAFSSEDEMFHSTMYDWLIQRGVADELLEMRPVFLEAHLKREPVTAQKFQLLWQFYVKDGQPLRAAEVLAALAESTDFDLSLDARLEYLTLAVGNAKSHPVSAGGRHESAIAFLLDLEEKVEVAQVQIELYNTLLPHMNEDQEVKAKIRLLSQRLFNITELYQFYADPFDLPVMKLVILHVSGHHDENLVRPIWNRIFDDALDMLADAQTNVDNIIAKIVPLGRRFYPSESAFPLRHIANLIVRFDLSQKDVLPHGWAPRILVQCGVPYVDIWDVFHEMYESHIPPFNDQANVQAISSDIAVLLADWLEEASRSQSSIPRGEFPVGRIDSAIDQYLEELEPGRSETKAAYEGVRHRLRRNW